MFLFSHMSCSINDLMENKYILSNEELSHTLLRFHVAGKDLIQQKTSHEELNMINTTLLPFSLFPGDFLETRGFDGVLFTDNKSEKFHILTSPFPRIKKYVNEGLMSIGRTVYHEVYAQNKKFVNKDDVSLRLIDFIRYITEEYEIKNANVTISGFGLGAKRAKHFAVAINHYKPKWTTHVNAFNDTSYDTEEFLASIDSKRYRRYRVILPDIKYFTARGKPNDPCITVHGLTSQLCYIKPWHHVLPPFSRFMRLFGKI